MCHLHKWLTDRIRIAAIKQEAAEKQRLETELKNHLDHCGICAGVTALECHLFGSFDVRVQESGKPW